MLLSLQIKNYALIENLEITFEKGFSTITGETGAGKSIILGALSLLIGQRADTSVLRDADKKSIVEAEWDISSFNVKNIFSAYDVEWDRIAIVRREIAPNGKTRAFVNDTPVNLQFLKELGEVLVDIHSQHENLLLRSDSFQLEVIDAVANNSSNLAEYKKQYDLYLELTKRLHSLQHAASKSKNDLEYNQYLFDELEKAKLVEGEDGYIETELKMLTNSEAIIASLSSAVHILANDDSNVLGNLKNITQSFNAIALFHSKISQLLERIESCSIELADIYSEIERELSNIDIDPKRIEYLNERIDLIYTLQQKHKVQSVTELIKIRDKIEEELELTGNFEFEIEKTQKKLSECEIKMKQLATKLSENRKQSALLLKKRLEEMLKLLGMQYPSIDILFSQTQNYTETGVDTINFLFAANKNTTLLPISQVASGGEISRVMLCLKYMISEKKELPTIIFDEIDTGVSGEIAYSMGELMKKMADNLQILSITHLPQIAALGSNQYKVYKYEEDESTFTNIKKLTSSERVDEIAQMISGTTITKAAIQNAKDLLQIK